MKIVTDKSHYKNIAEAIRTQTDSSTEYLPSELANAVANIYINAGSLKTLFDIKWNADYRCAYNADYANKYAENFSFLRYETTEEVRSMKYMFKDQRLITTIPLINTLKVTSMEGMFSGCSSLKICPALNCIECRDIDSLAHMFDGCTSLEEIKIYAIQANLDLSDCINLKNISQIIERLLWMGYGQTRVLKVSSQINISQEDIEYANSKEWVVEVVS